MDMLFAHANQIMLVHHHHVVQNVSLVQNVHKIKHVLMKNVSIHVQDLVERILGVRQLIIVQYVHVHQDIQEILLLNVLKKMMNLQTLK